jgi:hypothetical protein
MLNGYMRDAMEAARNGDREKFLTREGIFLKYFESTEMPDYLRRLYESCLDRALGSVNVLTMREKWLVEAEKIYKEILSWEGNTA